MFFLPLIKIVCINLLVHAAARGSPVQPRECACRPFEKAHMLHGHPATPESTPIIPHLTEFKSMKSAILHVAVVLFFTFLIVLHLRRYMCSRKRSPSRSDGANQDERRRRRAVRLEATKKRIRSFWNRRFYQEDGHSQSALAINALNGLDVKVPTSMENDTTRETVPLTTDGNTMAPEEELPLRHETAEFIDRTVRDEPDVKMAKLRKEVTRMQSRSNTYGACHNLTAADELPPAYNDGTSG
ncbi:hypothetical protein VTK73DRAFT_10394 [Phialemonium thermophilum]|uniref:Transmembrane protein n=1 Tax=Phialemonium thermophilum TaxID=223376 RepID=A0ABR3XG53_9PEZI